MTNFRSIIKIILFTTLLFNAGQSFGQGVSISRFCNIKGDSPTGRINSIIEVFKLSYLPAAQLTGSFKCKIGDIFTVRTSCIGPNRVGILSISNSESTVYPSGATRLFHLYKKQKDKDDILTTCLATAPQ